LKTAAIESIEGAFSKAATYSGEIEKAGHSWEFFTIILWYTPTIVTSIRLGNCFRKHRSPPNPLRDIDRRFRSGVTTNIYWGFWIPIDAGKCTDSADTVQGVIIGFMSTMPRKIAWLSCLLAAMGRSCGKQ